jgi:hypothetical protein
VIDKLTDNAQFTKPDVTLEEAKAAVDGLEAAYLAKKDGGHTATSAMYDAEDNADYYFRIIVAYVNRIAWGNETAILSSGFNLAKQPSSIQKPILSVIDGDNSGSVYLVARAIDKAGSYIWQMAKDKLPDTEEGVDNDRTHYSGLFSNNKSDRNRQVLFQGSGRYSRWHLRLYRRGDEGGGISRQQEESKKIRTH